jgi:hypothetical protein
MALRTHTPRATLMGGGRRLEISAAGKRRLAAFRNRADVMVDRCGLGLGDAMHPTDARRSSEPAKNRMLNARCNLESHVGTSPSPISTRHLHLLETGDWALRRRAQGSPWRISISRVAFGSRLGRQARQAGKVRNAIVVGHVHVLVGGPKPPSIRGLAPV